MIKSATKPIVPMMAHVPGLWQKFLETKGADLNRHLMSAQHIYMHNKRNNKPSEILPKWDMG